MKRSILTFLGGLAGAGLVAFAVVSFGQAAIPLRFFDVTCNPSHVANDDPLVFPGQPGAAHEHQFFGNTTTDANSTGASLLAANSDFAHTTCVPVSQQRHKDGAAYWAPTAWSCPTTAPSPPLSSCTRLPVQAMHTYYSVNQQPNSPNVQPFPVDFAQISGQRPIEPGGRKSHLWQCVVGGPTPKYDVLPDGFVCSSGVIRVNIDFPQCWNGSDLFRGDGSHMAFQISKTAGCPVGYPVLLAAFNMQLDYNVTPGQPYNVRIAETTTNLGSTGGAHADFLNAWDPATQQTLVDTCLNVSSNQGPPFCNANPND